MASDDRAVAQDVFTKPANGETAGSYTTDGRWNRGGWATYPSAEERAANGSPRPAPANEQRIRK